VQIMIVRNKLNIVRQHSSQHNHHALCYEGTVQYAEHFSSGFRLRTSLLLQSGRTGGRRD
jgi:hypothetical protein